MLRARQAFVVIFALNMLHSTCSGDAFSVIQTGSVTDLKRELTSLPSLELRDAKGFTPLHRAACIGKTDMVKFLLERKADANAKVAYVDYGANWGETPLHLACICGYVDVAKILLQHGADVNAKDEEYQTPLHHAANAAVVRLLLQYRADVTARGRFDEIPLHCACQRRDRDVAEALLQSRPDANTKDNRGWTPLHYVLAGNGDEGEEIKFAYFLLRHGANINARDEAGRTPLQIPIESGSNPPGIRMISFLLDHGADVNARDDQGDTPLHDAAGWGELNTIQFLLACKADINARNERGQTPLFSAAISSQVEAIRLLLIRKANIHAKDDDGATALRYVCDTADVPGDMGALRSQKFIRADWTKPCQVARLLLAKGIGVNVRDKNGWTPLHHAAYAGGAELVKLLLDEKAEVNAQTRWGSSPLHIACDESQLEVAKILLQHSADANAKENNGWTPLHYAASSDSECPEIVKLLLENRADPNAKDKKGNTPFVLAKHRYYWNDMKLLSEHGGHE